MNRCRGPRPRSGSRLPGGRPPPRRRPGSGRFELSGAGQDGSFSWRTGTNLEFCRTGAGWADLWVRLAEQAAADGGNGPHLDLDLCEPGAGGTSAPQDPMVARCEGGRTFDAWWHGPGGATLVNRSGAAGCTLQLTRSGTTLSGTFECRSMEEVGGTRSLDLLAGSFECAEQ